MSSHPPFYFINLCSCAYTMSMLTVFAVFTSWLCVCVILVCKPNICRHRRVRRRRIAEEEVLFKIWIYPVMSYFCQNTHMQNGKKGQLCIRVLESRTHKREAERIALSVPRAFSEGTIIFQWTSTLSADRRKLDRRYHDRLQRFEHHRVQRPLRGRRPSTRLLPQRQG